MKKGLPYILALLAGIALLPVPLLRDFHFESAMLAGTIGCFWAGIRAAGQKAAQDFFAYLRILGYLYLAALPLFIYSLITHCLTIDGAAFWLLTPVPSVFFGTAVGRLFRKLWFPFAGTLTILVLLFCALGIWMWEFFSFPQVYFYNHVWGAWPGPIYDESVTVSGAYLFFRSITFLWILLLWVIPDWSESLKHKLILGFSLLGLCLSYLNLSEMGVITPAEEIRHRLGNSYTTQHFEIFYDGRYFSEDEIHYWALKHEHYFEEITDQLQINWPEERTIQSYLYPHAWAKKQLVGAKFTSYVPIWLEQDQLHIARQQLPGVLKHEMVHVISKQFGNELFNGSWSIGLIEGLAEAIANDASSESTLDQIVAAEEPFPSAEEMQSALSFSGFYSSAGAISYTTTGSYVGYLLKNYPVDNFKSAYKNSDIREYYPVDFEVLISEWHRQLQATKLDSTDRAVSELIFAQRSLFEKTCPHSVTEELKLWDDYRYHLADQDTVSAYQKLGELYTLNSENSLVHTDWLRMQLKEGNYSEAIQSINSGDTLLTIRLLQADAYMLNGNYHQADSLLQSLKPRLDTSKASNFQYSYEMRSDSLFWRWHVDRRYRNLFPDSSAFLSLNQSNKILSINKALETGNNSLLILYSTLIFNEDANADWFGIYESMIDRLIYIRRYKLSEKWLKKIETLDLRARYRERLQELNRWYEFSVGQ